MSDRPWIEFRPEQFCASALLDVAANAATKYEEEPIGDEVDHDSELDAADFSSYKLDEFITPAYKKEVCTICDDLKAKFKDEVSNHEEFILTKILENV